MREGDNRTPEGVYFTRRHIKGRALLRSKYGKVAVPLDYPNPVDRRFRKTGYGIWLHGAGNDDRMQELFTTEGCVAFFNHDILEVAKYIQPNSAVVMIAKNADDMNQLSDREELYRWFTQWVESWRSRDSATLSKFYLKDFRASPYYRPDEKQRKNHFERVDDLSFDIDSLQILVHPKYAVSFFNQRYQINDHRAIAGKRILYWVRSGQGEWRILRDHLNAGRFFRAASLRER